MDSNPNSTQTLILALTKMGIRVFGKGSWKNQFGSTCQMAIFAPSNRVMVKAFMKNLPPKKVLILKKSGVKIPLVMSLPHPCTCQNQVQEQKKGLAN